MPSPFPPFLSTSLHGPKQEQSQNIQQPGVAKSDPAPGLNLLEGRMSKYLDLNADKKEALNESRSDVTQKKETIGSPTPEVHGGRGFMAKKSGKGG